MFHIKQLEQKSLLWITSDLKKLIRKRDSLYKRKKKSGDKKTAKKFRENKRIIQRELSREHSNTTRR